MVAIMHVVAGSVSSSSTTTLLALALGLLATSSCVAMRRARARGDVSSAIFVAASTLLLVALLATVGAHQRPDQQRRGPLKAAAWALSTTLTVLFAHRVAALASPPSLAVAVWSMAASAVAGGFCCLFVRARP